VQDVDHLEEPVTRENTVIDHRESGSAFSQRNVQLACAGISAGLLLLCACIAITLMLLRGDEDRDENTDEQDTETQVAGVITPEPETLTLTSIAFLRATITPPSTFTPLVVIPTATPFFPAPTFTPLVLGPNPPGPMVPAPTLPGFVGPAPGVNSGGFGYQIVVATRGEDSLFIVNQTPGRALPLALLQLGDGDGTIAGSEWGVGNLQPGTCVTAWKDGGNPESPNVRCTQVGADIIRDGPERFWKQDFNVYYNGALLGKCDGGTCTFTIPG
jgi:hypothetical protein